MAEDKSNEVVGSFKRLRAIRAELLRLEGSFADRFNIAFEIWIGFIPLLTLSAFLSINLSVQTFARLGGVASRGPIIEWFINVWLPAFSQLSSSYPFKLFAIAFGAPVALALIKTGVSLLTARRCKQALVSSLEHSSLVSQMIDAWDALPDIYDYVDKFLRLAVVWPMISVPKVRTNEYWTRLVVANLDWYIRPPARLLRWQWIVQFIRILSGLTVLLVNFIALYDFRRFADGQIDPSHYWNIIVWQIAAVLVFLGTLTITAIAPAPSTAAKARVLLDKMKPAFDVLGSSN